MIGQTVSHYRILEELGGGGIGVVYKAEDTKLGRLVALKFLGEELSRDAEAIKRFQREARAASSLNHPNICTIYEFDEHEGRQFIVMELMEGQTLKQRIDGKPLPTEEIVSLAVQIAEGLQAAHERGIIHRDIKPANLFVGARGQAKVLDFGVAKLLPRSDDATVTGSLTEGGPALGTLAYMAPEQLNRQKVDARTDIYALGCVLYEMATGQRPFQKEFGAQMIASILNRAPEAPSRFNPAVPARLDEIILKCLEKEPERRYQSAKELQGDLRGLAAPELLIPPRPEPRGWVRVMVRVGGVGVVAALVLLAVVLGLDVGGWRTRLAQSFGAGPPKIDSLAVLPLENLSGDPEQEYFADGMTEALITELGKISALKVISRTSVMQYKGAKKPLPEIAAKLGVTGIIEGSVRRAGNQVRITVQLVEAASDQHLWGESYDRDLTNILALQSEVAQAIANQVRAQLTPQEQGRLASVRPVNPEAYEAYLKGRYYWERRPGGLKKSFEYFQEAIAHDPGYAGAYVGLANYYLAQPTFGSLSPVEAYPRAEAAAKRGLELDNTLGEGHSILADLELLYRRDWTAAEREHQLALKLSPASADTHRLYAYHLARRGQMEQAIREIHRALELDPLSLRLNSDLGMILYFNRQYDSAIQQLRKTLELDLQYSLAHAWLGASYLAKGMLEEALAEADKADPFLGRPFLQAVVYARTSKQSRARKILAQWKKQYAQSYFSPSFIAAIHVELGENKQAIEWLERGYEAGDWFAYWSKVIPWLDPLRSDPRFQDWLRRMNFPE